MYFEPHQTLSFSFRPGESLLLVDNVVADLSTKTLVIMPCQFEVAVEIKPRGICNIVATHVTLACVTELLDSVCI